MEKMTIFSIVYNNYGRFVEQWNKYVDNQTIKVRKILALGKNHGVDIQFLKDNNIEYVETDSSNMGYLRNRALELVKTERWLYFSIDDELAPFTVEEIFKKNTDLVALRFVFNGKEYKSAVVLSEDDIKFWRNRYYIEGWVSCNKKIYYKEDVEIPNMPWLFDCFRAGLTASHTDKVVAIYHRWEGSHGKISEQFHHYIKYANEIDRYK